MSNQLVMADDVFWADLSEENEKAHSTCCDASEVTVEKQIRKENGDEIKNEQRDNFYRLQLNW